MKINMYDVKFGDCFVFENDSSIEKETLIVDCGSKIAKKKLLPIIDEIIKLHIEKKQCYALITHFHEDHIKGFQYMYDEKKKTGIFDKFYIPYILAEDEQGIEIFAEEVIFLYLILSKRTKGFYIAKSLLGHIQMACSLVKSYENIICLSTDKTFNFDDITYEVIWPDKENTIKTRREKCFERIEIIKKLFLYDNEVENIVNDFRINIKNWFKIIEDRDVDNEKKQATIESILDKQKIIINKLNNKKGKLIEGGLFINSKVKKALLYLSKDLSKTMNEKSIVFHNKFLKEELYDIENLQKNQIKEEKNDEYIKIYELNNKKIRYPLLMMGDITIKVIDNYLKDRFYNIEYEYIKVPHHGTETHYSKNIPKGNTLLISSGKFGRYKKISKNYLKHENETGKRICTSGYINPSNNNCEIKISKANCKSGECCAKKNLKHILYY